MLQVPGTRPRNFGMTSGAETIGVPFLASTCFCFQLPIYKYALRRGYAAHGGSPCPSGFHLAKTRRKSKF